MKPSYGEGNDELRKKYSNIQEKSELSLKRQFFEWSKSTAEIRKGLFWAKTTTFLPLSYHSSQTPSSFFHSSLKPLDSTALT